MANFFTLIIKPNSCIDPKVIEGTFKVFLHRAYKISNAKYFDEEIEFILDSFTENGHNRNKLKQIADEFKFKQNNEVSVCQNTNIDNGNIGIPTTANNNNDDSKKTVKLPWIPGISLKLRKAFRKAGYRVVFKSNANLQTILTARNKPKLPPNSFPGVYLNGWSCDT